MCVDVIGQREITVMYVAVLGQREITVMCVAVLGQRQITKGKITVKCATTLETRQS